MLVQRIEELIQNNTTNFPLTVAYKNGSRFYSDFIDMIKAFEENLSEKEQDSIYNKIVIAYSTDDVQVYHQCNCELIVLYFILRKYNSKFKYEPKYNGNYNPECSFEHNDVVVNIEVKTPDYSNRIEQENTDKIKIYLPERIPIKKTEKGEKCAIDQFNESSSNAEIIKRMDCKLKDFLEHSQKKFPYVEVYFNILVIALETTHDADEWYTYILGDTGAFTDSSYVKSNYENVDAILLCTPIAGINAWKKNPNTNVWYLENTINVLILDPRKENNSKGKYYFDGAIDMFGDFTKEFVCYLQELDKNVPDVLTPEDYLIHKQFDLSIITHYVEQLEKHSVIHSND